MDSTSKRYRAFISYSQRDKAVARRLHRALEHYRIPAGVATDGRRDRRLGRFFRDDDEMGASQSLGAALEGALDDAEALIVICSPASARSTWVDAEVRHFKKRPNAPVYAVIVAGSPHAADPDQECFCPALKQRIGADGRATGEPDEPRAPDLQHDGQARVVAQLAAGLLAVPFDDLWQRDRRRARWRALTWGGVGAATVAALGGLGLAWLGAQGEARLQAAQQALAAARMDVAEGRAAEGVARLAAHLDHDDTHAVVAPSLRRVLAWLPDPRRQLTGAGFQAVRLRDATALVAPGQGAYDISDVGVTLDRLLQSSDGRRLLAIGEQRVVVFDTATRARLAALDNGQVSWIGQALEAPSGLLLVTGAVLGPTNGSVWPHVLAVSADGRTVASHAVDAHMFWGSVAGVPGSCDALRVATHDSSTGTWTVTSRALGASGLGSPAVTDQWRGGEGEIAAMQALGAAGAAFPLRDAFMGEAPRHLFKGCGAPVETRGDAAAPSAGFAVIDVGLAREPASAWQVGDAPMRPPPAPFTGCTDREPCPVHAGSRQGETFSREALPKTGFDRHGWLPPGRWSTAETEPPAVYHEHQVFNSGHQLVLCAPGAGPARCIVETALGEDHAELPLLRSPDGRYLYWPFGGAVFDLQAMARLTPSRAVPLPELAAFDFEVDRPGLSVAVDGQLLSFRPSGDHGAWARLDDERSSPRFSVLAAEPGQPALVALASLGARQYLAVRADGLMVRLDAARGTERWRVSAAGLGTVERVELDTRRQQVLLVGAEAWRVFDLSDGFPTSGLLSPAVTGEPGAEGTCLDELVVRADGAVAVRCGAEQRTWQPRAYDGELRAGVQALVCLAGTQTSALETIRQCVLKP